VRSLLSATKRTVRARFFGAEALSLTPTIAMGKGTLGIVEVDVVDVVVLAGMAVTDADTPTSGCAAACCTAAAAVDVLPVAGSAVVDVLDCVAAGAVGEASAASAGVLPLFLRTVRAYFNPHALPATQ
jgi:hypothetical protein